MSIKTADLDKIGLLTLVQVEYFLDGVRVFARLRPTVPRIGEVVDLGKRNPEPGRGGLVVGVIWKEDEPGAPQTCGVLLKSAPKKQEMPNDNDQQSVRAAGS